MRTEGMCSLEVSLLVFLLWKHPIKLYKQGHMQLDSISQGHDALRDEQEMNLTWLQHRRKVWAQGIKMKWGGLQIRLMAPSFQTSPTLCHFCLNGSLVFIFRWVESPVRYQRTCCPSVSPILEGTIGLSLAKSMLVQWCGRGETTAPLSPTQITGWGWKGKDCPLELPIPLSGECRGQF